MISKRNKKKLLQILLRYQVICGTKSEKISVPCSLLYSVFDESFKWHWKQKRENTTLLCLSWLHFAISFSCRFYSLRNHLIFLSFIFCLFVPLSLDWFRDFIEQLRHSWQNWFFFHRKIDHLCRTNARHRFFYELIIFRNQKEELQFHIFDTFENYQ